MKQRINIKNRLNAVSPVISAILAITIITVTTSTAVILAAPYLDEIHGEKTLGSAEMQFDSIRDNIQGLVNGKNGKANVLSVAVDDGSISIDKNEYDRTIMIYSLVYDSDHEITVGDLDNNDNVFYVYLNSNLGSNIEADIQWPNNDDYGDEMKPVAVDGRVEASHDISGTVYIALRDTNLDPELFGKILLFDSNSLNFVLPSGVGVQELSLEQGGLIYFKDETPQVKRPFNVHLEDGFFEVYIIQTLASKSVSIGSHGFNVKINTTSHGTFLQERRNVYYLRLQMHGDNAQTWLDYVYNKYAGRFDGPPSDNTLFSSDSDDAGGVELTFLSSIVEFNIIL